MVKDIFPELRLDVLSIQKQIAPNMLCLRDLEVIQSVYIVTHAFVANFISIWMCSFEFSIVTIRF